VYESCDDTPFWKCPNHGILENNEIISGILQHSNLEMEDLREIYRKLRGSDVIWLKKHRNLLKKIYAENADFAGKEQRIKFCTEESLARLRLWRKIWWGIRHCPRWAYDQALLAYLLTKDDENSDVIYLDELEWLYHIVHTPSVF